MPEPKEVNPSKFTVDRVLYNNNDFSIVFGTWNPNNSRVIAMRWNEGEDGNGYPKAFGNPQWFIIEESVSVNILSGLLTNASISREEYLNILDVLRIFE